MVFVLAGALAIGLSLGLLGSGGSILTVPVLVYLVGQPEKLAIAGSLAVVGCISAAAVLPHARGRRVDYRSVLLFGVPGMGGAYLGAMAAEFVSGEVQLTVFAGLMLVASAMMFRPAPEPDPDAARPRWLLVAIEGLVVGAVTGFVGVGGGFLIVPALVLLGGLDMKRAVGTSLLIIALKSFTAFVKYLDVLEAEGLTLDWGVLAAFAGVGTVGSFVGSALGARLPQDALRRGFAVFLVVIGVGIVGRELTSDPAPASVEDPPPAATRAAG